jgi:outer membrane protein assembly factor BamD (BamD/ComL family)
VRSKALIIIMIALIGAKAISPLAYAAKIPDLPVPKDIPGVEKRDREVDTAALESMSRAVKSLAILLQKRKGTPGEVGILVKLIDLLKKIAIVEFRVAHGRTKDFTQYKRTQREVIKLTTWLVEKYPRDGYVPQAYLLRGKAHKELGERSLAEKDFTFVSKNWVNNDYGALGLLHLCDLLMENREYVKAISHLRTLENKTNKPFYSIVLDHLAWAHYYLNDITRALRYNEMRLAYHRQNRGADSEQSDLEVAGLNSALFYSKAMEYKAPGFSVEHALPYFKRFVGDKKLGKVMVRFSQHLRSNGLETELEIWSRIMIQEFPKSAEALEVYFVTLENQVNRRRFVELKKQLDILKTWSTQNQSVGLDPNVTEKVFSYLSTAASTLQGAISSKRYEGERALLVQVLQDLYREVLNLTSSKDIGAIARVHFNLGEINLELKKFADAEAHYRWVVDNADRKNPEDMKLVPKASMNAITSRFEILKSRNIIPQNLKAQNIATSRVKDLDTLLIEWMDWIKIHQTISPADNVEGFFFESNRAVYATGNIEEAVRRMSLFINRFPKSQYAIPSAQLILDTLIVSEQWEKTAEVANGFLANLAWKGTDFYKTLSVIAADVKFKLIENAYRKNEFAAVLDMSDKFAAENPNSPKVNNVRILAANAALGLKDKKRALDNFSKVSDKANIGSDIEGSVILTKLSVAEETFDLDVARLELKNYMTKFGKKGQISGDEKKKLRKKMAYLTLLSGNVNDIKEVVDGCYREEEVECDQIRAIAELHHPNFNKKKTSHRRPFKYFREGIRQNRAIWGAVALERYEEFSFKERLQIIDGIASDWSNLDPMVKYSILPYISRTIPETFELCRVEVKKEAPLKNRRDKRVELMKTLEDAGAKAIELPWIRIKSSVLHELANMNRDFIREFDTIQLPPGLAGPDLEAFKNQMKEIVNPFVSKADDYRRQSFSMAMNSAIEDQYLNKIFSVAFKENSDLVKDLKNNWSVEYIRKINHSLLSRVDPEGGWSANCPRSGDPNLKFRCALFKALRDRNWPRISVLLQEGRGKQVVSESLFALAESISYAIAGARAEGLAKLETIAESLANERKKEILIPMISHFYNSLSKERTNQWVSEFLRSDRSVPSEDDLRLLNHAVKWTGMQTTDSRISSL